MQRTAGDPAAPWSSPNKATLEAIFNYVRVDQDHDQIIETVPWCRYDEDNKVASIMLCTINYGLMQAVRHSIRLYAENPGFRYETYNKSQFVQKFGVTCYVPRDYACISPSRLLRTLFYKYPNLLTKEIRLISKSTFTSDPPGHPAGRRSRIGDGILLFDSPTLIDKLRPYDEDFRFQLSRSFNITLKGGQRGNNSAPVFAPSIAASVYASAGVGINQTQAW